MNLQEIAKEQGTTKQKVYRAIREHRIERGDVVISKAWIYERINDGKTPKQMADEAFCCEKTIYNKLHEYGFPVGKRGNPKLRHLTICDATRIQKKPGGTNEKVDG